MPTRFILAGNMNGFVGKSMLILSSCLSRVSKSAFLIFCCNGKTSRNKMQIHYLNVIAINYVHLTMIFREPQQSQPALYLQQFMSRKVIYAINVLLYLAVV